MLNIVDDSRRLIAAGMALWIALAACNVPDADSPTGTPPETDTPIVVAETITPTAIPTLTVSPTPTATPSSTPSPTPTATPTPFGCQRPPDDYAIYLFGDEAYRLSGRTVAMLEHAQSLYGGDHDLLLAITQGSYNAGVPASFGTHDGGGVVDLSMRSQSDWNEVLYDETDAIIGALRRAGFAAWVRYPGDLYANSPVHIHAVAVGDADLSEAAEGQLTGPEGYFRGWNGLPDNPQPDPHGGPILCPWMVEMGYADLS